MTKEELKYKGRIWNKDGTLVDSIINWLTKKRQSEELHGKMCEVTIKLIEEKNNEK